MAWFLCWSFPSSSSSSSSSTPKFKYDVFLNFRGDDTRNNFTSHLLKALRDKKIETFIDDEIERGDKISPSLLKAIEESRISIVIFSKGYASSRWCLEELVMILECSKKYNQIVMPVFYGVEPIHIRNQTGDFADAFADHEQRFKDKVQAWKDVLRQAANISGWNSNYFKPESALIVKIVEDISKRLYDVYRSRHDYLVRKELGMASSSFLCWSFPSSSPSSTPKFKYDVFLSFRGDDTRNNFTSNLQKALCDKNISTFIDDELERGDEISPSLLKAIEESRISVVIFSKGYASSRCCLEELVKILECSKKYNQIVMPVFYGVEPIHIRNQTGDFADAFADHEQRFKESLDKVQAWKDVLRQAVNYSGWNSDTIKPESALIEKIVEDILKRLNDMYPSCHDKNLVGIYSRIKQVESFLRRSTGDVGSVGIWGLGGIGKTTLAHAVYDRISYQFEGSCFVESIRETSEQSGESGLNNLRLRLVSALLGEEKACTSAFTSTRLGRQKLLIVFDDVTDIRQVESLTGGLDLGSGSRIIVTSRDKQVLRHICGEDQIYKVQDLCFNDALKLFCWYAFHQNNPKVDYKELSNVVVEKVGGVPLALKVLGSSLFQGRKEVWESAIQKLENNFDRDIHKMLKISYDGLDDNEQNMFLDITCFFKRWNVDPVKAITDASGFFTEIGISALVNKSLITISDNYELQMHDLVQAMGKEIVRQESINNPSKRSRLWHHNDIYDILTTDMGTETIVGISLDMSKTSNIHLHPRAFVNMQKLRVLQFYVSNYCENNKVYISQGLESIFTQLRYLHWYGCPLKSLHSNFHSKNLVILEMRNSDIEELWSGIQQLDNLKTIDLRGSKHLIRCPDFLGTPNLESLRLGWCNSLIGIPQSIQHLNKLESLDVQGCESITSIPDCTGLKSLKEINLTCCSKLKRLPELSNNLKKLDLKGCKSLLEIPSSFKHLTNLESLKLDGCEILTSIPDCRGLISLRDVTVIQCWKLKMLPEFPNNVRGLFLRDIPIEELPSSLEDICRLEILELSNCSRLKSLPSSFCKWNSLRSLSLINSSKIDKFPDDIGTLESLAIFLAKGTAIREVPSSISYLKSLRYLSFSGCKGEDGVGLLLPPLLGFHNLSSLDLSDCGITELPDNIGCLTSLESLCLDRNNFESIPESIINLSNLKFLDISYCQRIKVLPKLRYCTCISAVNCTSLEELSCPSFRNDIFAIDSALYSQSIRANFINCFKLNRNLLNNFVKDTLLNIQGLTSSVKRRSHHKVYKGALLSVRMFYPESEIPECFNIRSSGSSINVNLPPDCSNYNFLCFALCVVVRFPDPNHQCDQHRDYEGGYSVDYECNIKSKDGDRRVELFDRFGNLDFLFWDHYSGPGYIRSNHVIIGFGFRFFRELCDNEFSFRFYATIRKGSNIEHCKVEKCAVHLMFGLHLETSDECEEETSNLETSDECAEVDGPHLEESDKEDEPHPMRLSDECEEENEQHLEESDEEDEPHPKRLNTWNNSKGYVKVVYFLLMLVLTYWCKK